jgi:ribose 5-phosphate isomerase A
VWTSAITNEAAKRAVAAKMAARLAPGDVVGVGSGSTSFVTLQALAEQGATASIDWTAIPTSDEVEMACGALGVRTTSLQVARPDWAFDGADEVDARRRLIKGRGGALLREKLVLASSPERYIVVDPSKMVDRLGSRFPVPVEIIPDAVQLVQTRLAAWDHVEGMALRPAVGKDGPVITEHGNLLLDVRFAEVGDGDESALDAIPGVVECGLFIGYDPQIVLA